MVKGFRAPLERQLEVPATRHRGTEADLLTRKWTNAYYHDAVGVKFKNLQEYRAHMLAPHGPDEASPCDTLALLAAGAFAPAPR